MTIRILITLLVVLVALAALFPGLLSEVHTRGVLVVLVVLLLAVVIAGWKNRGE